MNATNQRRIYELVGAFVVGFLIGLVIFGWNLTPNTNFRNAGPQHLPGARLDVFVRGLAAQLSATGDSTPVFAQLCRPTEGLTAVQTRAQDPAVPNAADYQTVLGVIQNGGGCDNYLAQTGATASGGNNWVTALLSLLLLGALALVAGFVIQRRRNRQGDEEELVEQRGNGAPPPAARRQPEAPPGAPAPRMAAAKPRQTAEPTTKQLAGFHTVYEFGDDTFDKAFIIENANGDFLGECRIGLAETLGAGEPKQVAAFELWLFDRNDERTLTKIIMSEHAYYDEALRAKLATRGEPVLAHFDETIALETVSIIINAEITEIDYAPIDPANSVFERFGIELQAWVKAEGGKGRKATRPGDALDFA